MEEIPRDIRTVVRAEASSRAAYSSDLTAVRQRAGRRRRRTTLAAAAGVLAVVAGAGAAVTLNRPAPGTAPTAAQEVAPTGMPARTPPAQRLLLQGAVGFYRTAAMKSAVRLGGRDHVGEVLPTLQMRRHRVQGAGNWDRAVGLPDGRIVALGPRDLQPGVERTDGPDVTGLETNLVVVDKTGRLETTRDVRRRGEAVALVSATDTTAYLWRPAGLVAHDLRTGAERVAVPRVRLGVTAVPGAPVEAADVGGNLLVLARAQDPCTPAVFDLGSGEVVTDAPMARLGCTAVTGLRISPAADRVAVTYLAGRTGDQRLAVAGTADGAILSDTLVRPAAGKEQPLVEVGWLSSREVRALVVPVGPGTHQLVDVVITTR